MRKTPGVEGGAVLEQLRALRRQVAQLRSRVDELACELQDGRLRAGLTALMSETSAASRQAAMHLALVVGARTEMIALVERSRAILAQHQRDCAIPRFMTEIEVTCPTIAGGVAA